MDNKLPSQKSRGGYLDALLNGCPDAILAINAEGTITFANKEACKLMECEMYSIVGEGIADIYENLEAARETNRRLYLGGGTIHHYESKVKTRKGKIIPVRISASHLKDSSGNYSGAVGYFQTYHPWLTVETKVKAYAEELEIKLEEWNQLGTPIFELCSGLLVVVVAGSLDANRFDSIASNLLNRIKIMKSQVVIVDFAAVLEVGDDVSTQLVKTIRAIHLLGVQCILSDIQPSMAKDIEALTTADVNSIKSFSCMEFALGEAFNCVGYELRKRD